MDMHEPSPRAIREVSTYLHEKGHVSEGRLQKILAELPVAGSEGNWGQVVLRTVVGILLAVSFAVILAVWKPDLEPGLLFILLGSVVLAGISFADRLLPGDWTPTWVAAGALAVAVAFVSESADWGLDAIGPPYAFLLMLAFVYYPGSPAIVKLLGTGALIATTAAISFLYIEDVASDDATMLFWLGLSLLALAPGAVMAWRKKQTDIQLMGTLIMVIPELAVIFEVIDVNFDGGEALLLLLAHVAALILGWMMQQRGIVLGAAIIASGAAIFFGFEVGGLLLGLGVILAVAGGLLYLARDRFQAS